MAPRRLILDGSMGHTLKQRGLSDSFAEAAYANLRQPELVTSVHSEVSATPSERGIGAHTFRAARACAVRRGRRRRAHHKQLRRDAVRPGSRPCPVGSSKRVGGASARGARRAAARGGALRQRGGCHGHRTAGARRGMPATSGDVLQARGGGARAGAPVENDRTPSKEHMAHDHTRLWPRAGDGRHLPAAGSRARASRRPLPGGDAQLHHGGAQPQPSPSPDPSPDPNPDPSPDPNPYPYPYPNPNPNPNPNSNRNPDRIPRPNPNPNPNPHPNPRRAPRCRP